MAVFEVRLIAVLILVVYIQPTSASVDCSKAWMHPTPDCDADVRIGRLERLLEKSETKNDQQDAKISSLENTCVKKSQLSHSPPGTFSSYISGTHTYSKQQRVIFSQIIYNSGGYSSSTGIFTAPVSAVYVFNLNLVGCYSGYHHSSVRVMKGSKFLGYVGIGYNNNKYWVGTGSGTIITKVMRGEQIRVEAWYSDGKNHCLRGYYAHGYSYFSGYPIQYIQ